MHGGLALVSVYPWTFGSIIVSVVGFVTGALRDGPSSFTVGFIGLAFSLLFALLEHQHRGLRRTLDRALRDGLGPPDHTVPRILQDLSDRDTLRARQSARMVEQGKYEFDNEADFLHWLRAKFEHAQPGQLLRAACTEKAWELIRLLDAYFAAWFSACARGVGTERVFVTRDADPSQGASQRILDHLRNGAPCFLRHWSRLVDSGVSQRVTDALRGMGLAPVVSPESGFGFVLAHDWVLVHWGDPDCGRMFGWVLTGKSVTIFEEIYEAIRGLDDLTQVAVSA